MYGGGLPVHASVEGRGQHLNAACLIYYLGKGVSYGPYSSHTDFRSHPPTHTITLFSSLWLPALNHWHSTTPSFSVGAHVCTALIPPPAPSPHRILTAHIAAYLSRVTAGVTAQPATLAQLPCSRPINAGTRKYNQLPPINLTKQILLLNI